MESSAPVFEENYTIYKEKLAQLPVGERIVALGGSRDIPSGFPDDVDGILPFFGTPLGISAQGIVAENGEPPVYDTGIILFRHVIMCPEAPSDKTRWVSFKDLKDGGPLTVYFRDNVDQVLIRRFGTDVAGLQAAAEGLGGRPPELAVQYDVALQIQALPTIPVVLLFNGVDEEFPADCSILFEERVEEFLDAECIAMLGYRLARLLVNAGKTLG
ncbi:MAG: DUF3786 domain-containing protein [Desulfobacterales bacterium]|nr:DUF3786 domain-containing protein [Desulfobacterales bacterium]